MKKDNENNLDQVMRIIEENGLTYRQFQMMESLGQARIEKGKLLIKGRDY